MSKSLKCESYCSIDNRQYYEYVKKVKSEYQKDTSKRYEYANKIMPGQLYLYYVLDELQEVTMESAYSHPDSEYKKISEVTFSTEAIENLLRAMYFMVNHMHDGLPEHNYGYIKAKSSTFFNELKDAIGENIKVLEESRLRV